MSRETQVMMLGLGAALLVVFNLPDFAARGAKSAVRELLAPYHSALAAAGNWRPRSASPPSDREASRAARLQRLETLERENDELRRLLGLARRQNPPVYACEVIARDGEAGWWHTARLNRGSRDGISTNDVVITDAGVAGVVREVSPHTADILLISDPGCRIAVRSSRTGDFGLLAGGGFVSRGGDLEMLLPLEYPEMTFISRDSSLREGDAIVTSGLGGVYPEGHLVGHVRSVQPARSGLYLTARIVPAVDLARLRRVLVLGSSAKDGAERGGP